MEIPDSTSSVRDITKFLTCTEFLNAINCTPAVTTDLTQDPRPTSHIQDSVAFQWAGLVVRGGSVLGGLSQEGAGDQGYSECVHGVETKGHAPLIVPPVLGTIEDSRLLLMVRCRRCTV